ncbi:MAG: hypothetical protein ABIW49_03680 [Knoellia sp.]
MTADPTAYAARLTARRTSPAARREGLSHRTKVRIRPARGGHEGERTAYPRIDSVG